MKLLFYGCGQMGGAILEGVLAADLLDPSALAVLDPSEERRKYFAQKGVMSFSEATAALDWADCVLLGVKPQIVESIAPSIQALSKSLLLISIMAGVKSSKLQEICGSGHRIVRTMPNLPLQIGEGATAVVDGHLNFEEKELVHRLFGAAGKVVSVKEEQIDAVTGVSGSGPAWVFEFVEGWIRGGVRSGLSRKESEILVLQTLRGSLSLLEKGEKSPSDWTAAVCSPGGTTIAGVHALEANGFKNAIMDAVFEATQRSQELG